MKLLFCTVYVSLVNPSAKIIKVKIFTIHDSVDCRVGLIPRDIVVSAESRRRIRSGLIERH